MSARWVIKRFALTRKYGNYTNATFVFVYSMRNLLLQLYCTCMMLECVTPLYCKLLLSGHFYATLQWKFFFWVYCIYITLYVILKFLQVWKVKFNFCAVEAILSCYKDDNKYFEIKRTFNYHIAFKKKWTSLKERKNRQCTLLFRWL